ncbi:MAG: ATP-binding protein [Bacteroidota bacterium]
MQNSPIHAYIKTVTPNESRVLYASDNYIDMIGISGRDMVGRNMFELFPTEFAEKITEDDWSVVSRGEVLKLDEELNGRYYATIKFPMTLQDKNLLAGYTIDITERRQAENALIDAKDRAERMDKLKDAFIANISHEVRTPLNSIAGFSKLIEEACTIFLTEAQQGYFERIQFSIDRLMRTVDLILALSRIQTGDIQLRHRVVDLPDLLSLVLESLAIQAKQKGLSLQILNDIGPLNIVTDKYCLTEAISNLLHNAIKFTHGGSVKIHLTTEAGNKVFLEIIDTGIGISDEYKPHLFEPYSQEETGYSRRFEGIGLGMTLVKKYLDLLELPITFLSQKHTGTTFRIDLSRCVHAAAATSPTLAVPQDSVRQQPDPDIEHLHPTAANILLVEDDPASVQLMQEIMPEEYTLYLADDDASVYIQLDAHPIDLILMDVSLKGDKDGLQITRRLREIDKFRAVPIIAVTAHAFPEDGINCINAGCSEYFSKPVAKQHLLQTINRLLAKSRDSLSQE